VSNVITALITIAVILVGVAALAQSGFTSADLITEQWRETEERYGQRTRTDLQIIDTVLSGPLVDVTVKNIGTTTLRAFEDWDVVVEYQEGSGTLRQRWLPYSSSYPPGEDEWAVEGIYLDAGASDPEVFQPGILDPSEEAVIRINLSSSPTASATHKVSVGTYNGVSTSSTF
jgi:hypothetical protein